jgi:hypothetical protein
MRNNIQNQGEIPKMPLGPRERAGRHRPSLTARPPQAPRHGGFPIGASSCDLTPPRRGTRHARKPRRLQQRSLPRARRGGGAAAARAPRRSRPSALYQLRSRRSHPPRCRSVKIRRSPPHPRPPLHSRRPRRPPARPPRAARAPRPPRRSRAARLRRATHPPVAAEPQVRFASRREKRQTRATARRGPRSLVPPGARASPAATSQPPRAASTLPA